AENACGHDAVVDNRAVPRPIYTDPEIAGVGLTEAEAREQYGDDVATGMFPWVANARAVMQNETVGRVTSIHETRYGALLGRGMAIAAPEIPAVTRARAFELLYRRHVQDVYRYSLALLRNPADAEDVTQITFMNAYRAYMRGEEPLKPQNWLIKIAHNAARTR